MSISTRSKAAALVAGALCVAGTATPALAAGTQSTTGNDSGRVHGKPAPGLAGVPGKELDPRTGAAPPEKSCHPTSDDKSLATKISDEVNGSRMNGIDGGQVACARHILDATGDEGLNSRAGQIAVMTAMTETTLHNYKGGDRDSLGLFQQRSGWGSASVRLDPEKSTKLFLDKMQQTDWRSGDMGAIAQQVQRSAAPSAYDKEKDAAGVVVDALWDGGGGSGNPYTAVDVCGNGYEVIDSHKLGKSGRTYLLYNPDNAKNCVATLKATALGKKTATSAFLEVKGSDRKKDSGDFGYYAGPVSKKASSTCVKWGGAAGSEEYSSDFEHCD